MNIIKAVYNDILKNVSSVPPETGGILGGNDDIISVAASDCIAQKHMDMYIYELNTEFLNSILKRWYTCGIDFYGLFHTHPQNRITLSRGDIDSIRTIMNAMPCSISKLYFPIVIPNKNMYCYCASKETNGDIFICEEKTVLL